MLDTDATVTTGLRPSTFGRLPTGFGDPDPTDLDRLAASLDYLALSLNYRHPFGRSPVSGVQRSHCVGRMSLYILYSIVSSTTKRPDRRLRARTRRRELDTQQRRAATAALLIERLGQRTRTSDQRTGVWRTAAEPE